MTGPVRAPRWAAGPKSSPKSCSPKSSPKSGEGGTAPTPSTPPAPCPVADKPYTSQHPPTARGTALPLAKGPRGCVLVLCGLALHVWLWWDGDTAPQQPEQSPPAASQRHCSPKGVGILLLLKPLPPSPFLFEPQRPLGIQPSSVDRIL